jgi:signal transduction histidine kinase
MGVLKPHRKSVWMHGPTLLAVGAAVAVLVATVLGTRLQLRRDLRAGLSERESRGVAALFQGRFAALRAEGVDDPLLAAVEVATLPQLAHVQRITVFDARGALPSRIYGDSIVPPPGPAQVERLIWGEVLQEVQHGAQPEARPAAGGSAVLRMYIPLPDGPAPSLVGILGVEVEGAALLEEYARMDRSLWRQGFLTVLLSGTALTLALVVAFGRLARTNRDLLERGERLARANRELMVATKTGAMGAVASHLVHGLRNPLAGLQAFLAAIGDRPVSAEDRSEAMATLRRMRALIDGVVRVLRDSGGVSEFEMEIGELLPRVLQRVDPRARARGVQAVLRCGSTRRLSHREANILLLVVENLVGNALEAAPDRSEVVVAASEVPGEGLVVRVSDTGSGIAPSVREHLFEPTVSTKPGGSGLGLAITRQLALSMGGDVVLEATGHGGSTFAVHLPPEAARAAEVVDQRLSELRPVEPRPIKTP